MNMSLKKTGELAFFFFNISGLSKLVFENVQYN